MFIKTSAFFIIIQFENSILVIDILLFISLLPYQE